MCKRSAQLYTLNKANLKSSKYTFLTLFKDIWAVLVTFDTLTPIHIFMKHFQTYDPSTQIDQLSHCFLADV